MAFAASQNSKPQRTALLRILATTDLHMQLLGYDYWLDAPSDAVGLTRLIPVIERLRADCRNMGGETLLFDNGDILQGTPVAETLAKTGETHPLPDVLLDLGYDAIALGNHDFDFGLDHFDQVSTQAQMPVLCANLIDKRVQPNAPIGQPFALLTRNLSLGDETQPICIGVMGVAPPQTVSWGNAELKGAIEARDILETVAKTVPVMRAGGADLVVVLSHSGFAEDTSSAPQLMDENVSAAVARLPGVDAVIAGHTHEIIPEGPRTPPPGEAPLVLPGFWGSHLGQIDLSLTCDEAGAWRVASSLAVLHPGIPAPYLTDPPSSPLQSRVEDILRPSHIATLKKARTVIGTTPQPLTTWFAQIAPCSALSLLSDATISQAAPLADPDGGPLIAAVAPFKCGGRGGAAHYTDIQAGPLQARHIADLYPFHDKLCVLPRTGAQIKEWLEHTALCFHRVLPWQRQQNLMNEAYPGYNFDCIPALKYQIDLTAAAGQRIIGLSHNGAPVDPCAPFQLVTTTYRARGGGGFTQEGQKGAEPCSFRRSGLRYAEAVEQYIKEQGQIAQIAGTGSDPNSGLGWNLTAPTGTSAIFTSTPRAARHLPSLAKGSIRALGPRPDGFMNFQLSF